MEMIKNLSPIGLILVTFNRAKLLDQLLERIASYNWAYSDFIVINNSSQDNTSRVLEKHKKKLSLRVIDLNENMGHGAGLAIGLVSLNAIDKNLDYVVFLEDDSIPEKNYLVELISRIKDTDYSMVSSAGFQVGLGKRIAIKPKGDEIVQADFALFDGAIARFEDLKTVGFPIRDWFMMFDDFEYCYRIRKGGFKIGVFTNPYIKILHEGWGGGTSHSDLWRFYYQSRNFVHFVRLHFTFFNLVDFLILQSKRLIGGVFIKNGFKLSKYGILGVWDGLIGVKGKNLNPISLKRNN